MSTRIAVTTITQIRRLCHYSNKIIINTSKNDVCLSIGVSNCPPRRSVCQISLTAAKFLRKYIRLKQLRLTKVLISKIYNYVN